MKKYFISALLSAAAVCGMLSITAAASGNLGDVDGDNQIDASDATAILTEYALLSSGQPGELTAEERLAADTNGDGFVDSSDATNVLVYYGMTSTGSKLSFSEFMNGSEPEWKQAYIDCIEGQYHRDVMKCALIYIDDDDIPELYIVDNDYGAFCTYYDGKCVVLDCVTVRREMYNYFERQNDMLWSSLSYSNGEQELIRYSIKDGTLAESERLLYAPDIKGKGNDRYYINGESVTKEAHEAKKAELFEYFGDGDKKDVKYMSLDEFKAL